MLTRLNPFPRSLAPGGVNSTLCIGCAADTPLLVQGTGAVCPGQDTTGEVDLVGCSLLVPQTCLTPKVALSDA